MFLFGGFESLESRTIKRGSALERFGWNHHVHVYSICTSFPLALWSILRLFLSMQNVVIAELGHAVVLLLGAVVPQALAVVPASGAVVPQVPMIVPLPWSGSTVASGQALWRLR